jgi:hypothetical protein
MEKIPKPSKSLPKPVTLPKGWYPQSKISKMLGCNFDTLKTAIRGGLPVRDVGGKTLVELAAAREWFATKEHAKAEMADLKKQKLQTEINRNRAAEKRSKLELKALAGELHSKKDCCSSFGECISTVWMEFSSLPGRIQAAHPEIQGLEKTVVDLINPIADRLNGFSKQHEAKEVTI